MNIYVANINFRATDSELKALFEQYGQVSSAKIIMDKMTGRSRGFGFIEMPNDDDANKAISELNGYAFMEKQLVVNVARPKTDDFKKRDFGGNKSYDKPRY